MKKLLFNLLILFSLVVFVSAQTAEATKINEFDNTGCEDYISRLHFFFVELNDKPNAKGYVFVYAGKLKNSVYDKKGKFIRDKFTSPRKSDANDVLTLFKQQVAFTSFPSDKIVFIEAGFREKFNVEFWIVPDGAVPPKPTPTLAKIKQRKAKYHPKGLCGDL